jgi:hypothetical protein
MANRTRRSKLFCEFIYCGCGCGFTRSKYDSHYREMKYLLGHHCGLPRQLRENPIILCGCGCGKTLHKYDRYYGERRFINYHQNRGENNPVYIDGKRGDQYVRMVVDSKRIKAHRHIYEKHYRCCLLPWVVIHHINDNPADNRIENLQPMTKGQHQRHHHLNKPLRRRLVLNECR